MRSNPSPAQRYGLPAFLILTPLISLAIGWLLGLPVEPTILALVAVPPLLAVLLAGVEGGSRGITTLLRDLFEWRMDLRGYAAALGLALMVHVSIEALGLALGWIPRLQLHVPSIPELLGLGIAILMAAALEEIGWRGYALPRLLRDRSPLFAALLIGVLWGGLHLGLVPSTGRPWLPTMLVPFAFSVPLTWLYVHTRGSLSMATLCHFAFNYLGTLHGGASIAQLVWLEAWSTLALAALIVIVYGRTLQRSPAKPAVLGKAG